MLEDLDSGIYLVFLLRTTVAWVLISAGIEKFRSPQTLLTVIQDRVPRPTITVNRVRFLSVTEISLGMALLAPVVWIPASILAAILLTTFALLVAFWLRTDTTGDCGCGGVLPTQDVSIAHAVLVATLATCSAAAPVIHWSLNSPASNELPLIERAFLSVVTLVVLLCLSATSSLRSVRRARANLDTHFFGGRE